jgi:acyl carrier protein
MSENAASSRPRLLSGRFRKTASEAGALAQADAATIEAWIMNWIATETEIDATTVRADQPFIEYADSIIAMKLSARLETLLGRSLSPSIAWEFETISELAAHLAAGGCGTATDIDAERA